MKDITNIMSKYTEKGDIMDVSQATAPSSPEVEVMKKAAEVQERQILKVLESATEQSKQAVAQKTGLGNHLNIAG